MLNPSVFSLSNFNANKLSLLNKYCKMRKIMICLFFAMLTASGTIPLA